MLNQIKHFGTSGEIATLIDEVNTWLREKTDVDWVYSYNPWTAPLAA